MQLKRVGLALFLCGLSLSPASFATDLLQVYHDSSLYDPTFQAATSTRRSVAENLPIQWAGYLPNLSLTANSLGNRTHTQGNDITRYNSKGYSVSLTQALINFSQVSSIRKASAQVKSADSTYAAAAQDLILRTATAYFNVLSAADNLRLTRAQRAAVAKQLSQAKARFDVGVDAVTALDNAQASYDSLAAQEIADWNALANSYESLRVLTNQRYSVLARVENDLPLLTPNPESVSAWVDTAEKGNFNLKAVEFTAEAARQNINVNETQHLPTIEAVGNYGYSKTGNSAANSSVPQSAGTGGSVGVQLNMPIFSGGGISALTRQAEADYQTAVANLADTHRTTLAGVYQTYNDVEAGIQKIKADKQAVQSAQAALNSNQAAFEAGTMTIVDVLNAEQSLYTAKSIYKTDQYAYLLNTLRLKSLAGFLNEEDLRQINKWLVPGENDTANPTLAPPPAVKTKKSHSEYSPAQKKPVVSPETAPPVVAPKAIS